MKRIELVQFSVTCLCLVVLMASPARSYEYADDFSTDQAASDSYRHSALRSGAALPLPGAALFYMDGGGSRGLVFEDWKGRAAELAYCFPLGSAATQRPTNGTVEVDVSFPCNTMVSQFPAGYLSYAVSGDGMAWSALVSLTAGHHRIPVASPKGTCYILFSGTRAMVDNIRVSLQSPSATIHVPAQYARIQAAIDAARDGDVIEVAAGVYEGAGNRDIEFRGKAITVRSADGPEHTIIDCGGAAATNGNGHRGFIFRGAEGADAVLSGFTIRGGRVFGSEVSLNPPSWPAGAFHPIGGGIYCEFSSPSIVDCVVTDCGAEIGGGIGCVGSDPVITDCVIENCTAGGFGAAALGGRGGAIGLIGGCHAAITNCTIENNTGYKSSYGAAIYCFQSSAIVGGCVIAGNSAPGDVRGGGAYCAGGGTDVTFRNCVIADNEAEAGGGVFAERSDTAAGPNGQYCRVRVLNCTIARNRLSGIAYATTGRGIHAIGIDIQVSNSILWQNAGASIVLAGPVSANPVTYCNVQGGYPGPGNMDADPLFAASDGSDYHLKSRHGRYDENASRWVTDSTDSPCIDAGDPTLGLGEEPAPHGDRVNMGAYGGSAQASKGVEHVVYHVNAATGRSWNSGLSKARAVVTIQSAIDAARSGDTVLVWPGVYREEITFDRKAITVCSAADAAVVMAPHAYAFSFYGAESTQSVVANFVIRGCPIGAIFCSGASPTLKNLTVVDNQFGVEAYEGADPNIISCIFSGNSSGDLFLCKARYSRVQQDSPDRAVGNINAEPVFADPEQGDFHLRSRYGRYVPELDDWVSDELTSPCIDAGDPDEYPREPMPNGSRVNMGAYGGSPYASLSSGPVCE